MKFLLFVLILLILGTGVYYVMLSKDVSTVQQVQHSTQTATDATDTYNQQQEDLLRQMGQ